MKSLQEFKVVVEEEKADYSKFDALVRAGLGNRAQIQRMHQILAKMGEEKPQFTNADRAIIQNLFTKMVDLITNNPQIFRQTRKAVSEQVKISTIEAEALDEALDDLPKDPPVVLVLKRKAIRLYPDKTRIALYYNDKLNKYFSVPYMSDDNGKFPLQAESTDQIQESVIDSLYKILNENRARSVKFESGHSKKVSEDTALAITEVYSALNENNKKKFAGMLDKSPQHFQRAADFALKHNK